MAQKVLALSKSTMSLMLERLCDLEVAEPFCILSIIETDEAFPSIPSNLSIHSVLCLKFDDVEPSDGCMVPATDLQIKTIARYIHSTEGRTLVVNCKGGISRSVAIAAAYEVYYGLLTEDKAIARYSLSPYCINIWLYREVLNALYV